MKRILSVTVLVILAVVVAAVPVLASVITDAEYVGEIAVVNVGTATTNVSVPFTLSTSNLITNNYIDADCTNTAIIYNGADAPYMPARTGQTTWMMFCSTVQIGNSTANLYTGGPDMSSKIRYFPGVTGFTTADSPLLELGNNFEYEIKGYFDLSVYDGATRKFIVDKELAFFVYYLSATKIRVDIDNGAGVTVLTATTTDLTSGEHTLKVTADGTDLKIYWDAVQKASVALGGVSVPDSAPVWRFVDDRDLGGGWGTDYSMPYIEYQKITVSSVLRQQIEWENGATFTDLSGNGHTATPTWRTTTSDADVSASITTFVPVSESEASSYTLAGGVSFVDAVPGAIPNMYDEGETGGLIIDDAINPALAEADIPEAFFWYPVAFAIAIGLGFAAFGWTKQLIVQAIVSAVVMAGFAGGGVLGDGLIPWWTVIVFIVEGFMVLVIQERYAA